MKIQRVIKGKPILFDSSDWSVVDNYRWRISSAGYAISHQKKSDGGYRTISLHRLLMNVLNDNDICVDHRNRNTLDNTRINLRLASRTENARNVSARGEIKYLGVCFVRPSKGKYKYIKASIFHGGKSIHLGIFDTPEEAAEAYNQAAIKYFGEFANLNKI